MIFRPCRERLFGTGSQTNAFTDFHHTVYFACCPVDTLNLLGRPRPMLPMALDALSEVNICVDVDGNSSCICVCVFCVRNTGVCVDGNNCVIYASI